MDVLQWSRHYRCFPGQGDFDVAGLVGHVLRAGYRGPSSLEVFNDVFRQADAGRTARDAMRSLIALVPDADAAGAVIPTGFAFAELATPGTGRLSGLLTALGFARTGGHPENRSRRRSSTAASWGCGRTRAWSSPTRTAPVATSTHRPTPSTCT
jgi:4-hydroxyphenylpyruvate dioxygenase